MCKIEQPIKESNTGVMGGDTYTHPAYGTIRLTTPTGGNRTLFGSDIKHGQSVCISIHRAKLDRHLNRDWIHGDITPIIEIELSHAQFANFITSSGQGAGNPCTLRYASPKGSIIEEISAIENAHTKHETNYKEIRDSAIGSMEKINSQIKALGELIGSGKTGKKELKEIHRSLEIFAGHVPGDMEFVIKSAEEALETATSHAKIEVEAYVTATAQRLGFESIEQLAITSKPSKPQGE